MKTGEIITNIRESRGVLQKDLARAINIDPVVLNRIEKGKRPVRGEEIKAIAEYFNVSTDYLLGNDYKKKTPVFSEEESNLVDNFRKLNEESKRLIREMIGQLAISRRTA